MKKILLFTLVLTIMFALAAPAFSANAAGSKVLLIQDYAPWGSTANTTYLTKIGANYDVATSIAALGMDFSEYGVVIIANGQNTSTYQYLTLIKAKLENYVRDGGVLLFGACDNTFEPNYTIPGDVVRVWEQDNYNKIADSSHPVVSGELTDNGPLADSMLYGNKCSHVYFDPSTFPAGTRVILQNTNNNPTLIEYPLGKGTVIASGLTWEWAYSNYNAATGLGAFSPVAMEGYLMYGIKLSEVLPESVTIDPETATLFPGETLQLTANVLPVEAVHNEVMWESGDTSVATVSEGGLVTAVAPGEARIMAKTKNGIVAVCAVTVLNRYTVIFKDWDGTVLKTQVVNHGSGAAAPDAPERTGYVFTGWDMDFSSITDDLTVTAQYESLFTGADATAFVTKLNGNKNDLTIIVTEHYYNEPAKTITKTFRIDNNAAGTYEVGPYKVYVDTKGNVQIRACYIVE